MGLEHEAGHVEEQDALFDDKLCAMQDATRPHPTWTDGELRVLGERVRDFLRDVARRAVTAFVRGGVERGDAELYVHEDLRTVADETWTPPKGMSAAEVAKDRKAAWRGGAGG